MLTFGVCQPAVVPSVVCLCPSMIKWEKIWWKQRLSSMLPVKSAVLIWVSDIRFITRICYNLCLLNTWSTNCNWTRPLTWVFFVDVTILPHLNATFWLIVDIATLKSHVSHGFFLFYPKLVALKGLSSVFLNPSLHHFRLFSCSGKSESMPTGQFVWSAMPSANLQTTTLWPATVR